MVVSSASSVEVDSSILTRSKEVDIVVEVQKAEVNVRSRSGIKGTNPVVSSTSPVKVDISILGSHKIDIVIEIQKAEVDVCS